MTFLRLAKSLLLEKSPFLRNQCLLGSCLAGPRPKVHGEVGQGRADTATMDSVSSQGRLSQRGSTSAVGQRSGLALGWGEQRDAREEAPPPLVLENPDLDVWSSSIMRRNRPALVVILWLNLI